MSMVSLPGLRSSIETMSQQRNLPPLAVQEALQEALLKGYERYRRTQNLNDEHWTEDYFDNFSVKLDLKAEGFRIVASKTVVETVEQPDREISLQVVIKKGAKAKLGDRVVVDVTPNRTEFGRLVAHQTKQVLLQKLQEQQCKFVQDEFADRKGTVLQGRMLRLDRGNAILGISTGPGKPEVEAELPKYEKLPNDDYHEDAQFLVYLKKVFTTASTRPLLRVSRATSYLISGLFARLVPEIQQEIVEVKGVVRDSVPANPELTPRSKLAVHSKHPDVDPVAACIGPHGEYLEAVVNEMRGEKIEVIRWSEDIATYIANALCPAKVEQVILLDTEQQHAEAIVTEDQLSLAIGPDEQNLRLASRLTEWKIDIKTV